MLEVNQGFRSVEDVKGAILSIGLGIREYLCQSPDLDVVADEPCDSPEHSKW